MNKTDKTLGLARRFPTLTEILGKQNITEVFHELIQSGKDAGPLFHQAESDLHYLNRRLHVQTLRHAYKHQLQDKSQFIQTVYEIYTAALLACVSDDIKLHVPGKGRKNCDFFIKVRGCEIYGDVKTRHDQLPFNTSPKRDASGETLYMASRATVDPHIAEGTPHRALDNVIPESTELRQRIVQALEQLPDAHPNLVVLGLVDKFAAFETTQQILEAVILGDCRDRFFHDRFGRSQHIAEKLGNGVFDDPVYGDQITSIAWVCLKRSRQGLIRRSGIFFNSNAKHNLPEDVTKALEQTFDREKILNRELKRIVAKLKSDYQPERIILFGSLAQGEVKEGSDIDLAIIKDTNKRPLDRCLEVASICQPSLAINFVVYTPEEFRMQKEAGNFFVVDEILERGHVLDG